MNSKLYFAFAVCVYLACINCLAQPALEEEDLVEEEFDPETLRGPGEIVESLIGSGVYDKNQRPDYGYEPTTVWVVS
jgi:hypothetical protein